jgi:hypothetical protein
MKRSWSNLTEKERDEDAIYQKGYADGRKCMVSHIKRMQKKIDKLEARMLSKHKALRGGVPLRPLKLIKKE